MICIRLLKLAAIFLKVSADYVRSSLTLKKENIRPFMDRFEQFVNSTITEEQLVPRIFVDSELSFSEINEEFFQFLNKFQPFGPENMSPVFVSRML